MRISCGLGRPVPQKELTEKLFLARYLAADMITKPRDPFVFLLVLLSDFWPVAAISKES